MFDDEISSTEIAYLVEQFRNFLKNNNRRARNKNFTYLKNVKKNDHPRENSSEKLSSCKDKVGQSSSNPLGQQGFRCQDCGLVRFECPTYLKFKGKVMVVAFSDDEEFDSDQEGNFTTFTATTVVDEFVDGKVENPSDKELFENSNLQETYNKLCKVAAKDVVNANLTLKMVNTLELEKKNLLIKLFGANELINAVEIVYKSLIEKVKSLETELNIAREQLGRNSSSKLDNMLSVQKPASKKTRLGFVESGPSSLLTHAKFVSPMSEPKSEVRVQKEEVLAIRRIRVDLSDTNPNPPTYHISKKQHKCGHCILYPL